MAPKPVAKKLGIALSVLKMAKDWWPFLILAGGFLTTIALLPQKVVAVEKKVDQVADRQVTIEKYIVSLEEQKELAKKAPEGWLWSEKEQKYVPDPLYRPKKGK